MKQKEKNQLHKTLRNQGLGSKRAVAKSLMVTRVVYCHFPFWAHRTRLQCFLQHQQDIVVCGVQTLWLTPPSAQFHYLLLATPRSCSTLPSRQFRPSAVSATVVPAACQFKALSAVLMARYSFTVGVVALTASDLRKAVLRGDRGIQHPSLVLQRLLPAALFSEIWLSHVLWIGV
jgi:hypothetical protein